MRSNGNKGQGTRKQSKAKRNGSNRNRDLATVADTKIRRFTPLCFGFPDRLVTTLRYHSTITLQSVSQSVGQYGFRWNSIFDPDYSAAGHQPLYRDTYAAIYDQYSVISARAHLTFVNAGSAITYINAVTDDDSTPSTTGDTLAEQSHGVSTILGVSTGGRNSHIMELNWDCKKVLGIDPYASETYKTAVGSNPAEQSFLWLTNIATSGSTDVVVNVMLEFDTLFTELTTPVQS